jgi:homoserine acetyltransferase
LYDARIHAMMCYRTPESFKTRFGRSIHQEKGIFNIDSWLLYHGEKLDNRFLLQAYKLMNHLLRTIDISEGRGSFEEVASQIKGSVHLISIDTDLFFTDAENRETYTRLMEKKVNLHYHTISSVHGHDAFLIEYDQLNRILLPLFTNIHIHS